MKLYVILLVCAICCQASAIRFFGWLSNDADDVIEFVEETTEECLRLGGWGQCDFYNCLEDRFPCGDEGYTNKFSKHFCTKINDNYDTFDQFGKRWLNQTSICLHSHVLPIYEQESTTCGLIKAAGIQGVIDCNSAEVDGRDFCDFLQTNGDAYNALMGREEIMLLASLGNVRVYRTLISQAVYCGVSSMTDTFSYYGSTFAEYAASILSSFRGWMG